MSPDRRRLLASILATAVEDATDHLSPDPRRRYNGHWCATPVAHSIYRHYHRLARRAWRRVARQQIRRSR